ncbi:hypothetical protein ACWGGS_35920 [Streptomyces decoyicus]
MGSCDTASRRRGPSTGAHPEATRPAARTGGGSFRGGYRAFHRDVLRDMPPTQSPNPYLAGRPADAFLEQRPFTV